MQRSAVRHTHRNVCSFRNQSMYASILLSARIRPGAASVLGLRTSKADGAVFKGRAPLPQQRIVPSYGPAPRLLPIAALPPHLAGVSGSTGVQAQQAQGLLHALLSHLAALLQQAAQWLSACMQALLGQTAQHQHQGFALQQAGPLPFASLSLSSASHVTSSVTPAQTAATAASGGGGGSKQQRSSLASSLPSAASEQLSQEVEEQEGRGQGTEAASSTASCAAGQAAAAGVAAPTQASGLPQRVQMVASSPAVSWVRGLGPVQQVGLVAALVAAVAVPKVVGGAMARAERARREVAEREANAASLRLQKQRFQAALAFDSVQVELPAIKDLSDVDPNELPAASKMPAWGDIDPSELEGEMKREWERFMAASKVALVRDLWDARSAAAEEQLAPRVSKEQLEEMTRRVRDANKGHEGEQEAFLAALAAEGAISEDVLIQAGMKVNSRPPQLLEIREKKRRPLTEADELAAANSAHATVSPAAAAEPAASTGTSGSSAGAAVAAGAPGTATFPSPMDGVMWDEGLAERAARRRARLAGQFLSQKDAAGLEASAAAAAAAAEAAALGEVGTAKKLVAAAAAADAEAVVAAAAPRAPPPPSSPSSGVAGLRGGSPPAEEKVGSKSGGGLLARFMRKPAGAK